MLSYWYHCMGKNFPFGLGAILINKEKNERSIGEGVFTRILLCSVRYFKCNIYVV
jgi:hypothetical protein